MQKTDSRSTSKKQDDSLSSPSEEPTTSPDSSPTSETTEDLKRYARDAALTLFDASRVGIGSPTELQRAVDLVREIRSEKDRREEILNNAIKPIRAGLDELYAIRNAMNRDYMHAVRTIAKAITEYHDRQKPPTEPEPSTDIAHITTPDPEGMHYRTTWRAKVTDKLKLIKAVAEGKPFASKTLIDVNSREANALARSLRDELNRADIGIEAEEERKLIVRKT